MKSAVNLNLPDGITYWALGDLKKKTIRKTTRTTKRTIRYLGIQRGRFISETTPYSL